MLIGQIVCWPPTCSNDGSAGEEGQDARRELREEHADVDEIGPKLGEHRPQAGHGKRVRDLQDPLRPPVGAEAGEVRFARKRESDSRCSQRSTRRALARACRRARSTVMRSAPPDEDAVIVDEEDPHGTRARNRAYSSASRRWTESGHDEVRDV